MPDNSNPVNLTDKRRAGILLHITSLPGIDDQGDMGHQAYRFIEFLSAAGMTIWQTLPLGAVHDDRSPYQCLSVHAGNPLLISQDWLKDRNWLNKNLPRNSKRENWLRLAYEGFKLHANHAANSEFKQFCKQEKYWLGDYALYCALREQHKHRPWMEWPVPIRDRMSDSLAKARHQLADEIERICFEQFVFFKQWHELRDYAHQHHVYLFGDMPIFVAHDSADVWANQHCFLLDEDGMPTVVTGVPPDYFSATGQRWGNPHYNWERMQETGFDWWLKRLQNHLQLFDLVRIDHFRGLEAVWTIDATCETAIDGRWQKVAGDKLLQTLQQSLASDSGAIPLVAEDLGVITPEVNALRDKYRLPGMSVLQFSFDGFADNPHKPKNIEHNRIAYTGTHDNDTTEGWIQSLDADTQHYIMQILKIDALEDVTDALIRMVLKSRAQLAVVPLQDFLHLDSDARMNIPGTMDGNWQWQFDWSQITSDLAVDIRQKIDLAGR